MLAIKCPFCQHENKPGTRFCAECGFSMHLKICPNSQCGQISDVGAAVCVHCGQPFPKMALAPIGTANVEVSVGSQKHGGDSAKADKGQPRVAALPLIMMAIVAGGLPMLWANRDLLPTPKTWQINTPDVTKAGVAAPTPIAQPPQSVPVNSASAPPPPKADAPGEVGSGSPVSNMDTTNSTARNGENKPATGDTPKKVVKAPRVKAKEPPRPCTEATVALGLCDPKQAAK